MLLISANLFADIRCSLEFDGQQGLSEAEIPSCLKADDGIDICPLQMLACTSQTITSMQQVTTQGNCSQVSPTSVMCDVNATAYSNLSSCQSACTDTQTIQVTSQTPPTCPAGGQFSCHDVSGTSMCSPNQCFDASTVSSTTDLTTESQSHDSMNSNGECTGEIQIFPGVKTGCRLGGYQTRWDNCCNNGKKIISDSFSNPIEQGFNAMKSIAGVVEGYQDVIDNKPLAIAGNVSTQVFGTTTMTSALGIDPQSAIEKTEQVLEMSGAYVNIDLAVDAANWLFTPCSKDSPSVAIIASDYCYKVGTKCIEDWTVGGCVQRAEVHCCFNSLMARIVHQQGRPQLTNFTWGTADSPNCNGFTTEQFQALDFSKFDFSEYESEVRRSSAQELQNSTNTAEQKAISKFGTSQ